jgi:hypothetical protein
MGEGPDARVSIRDDTFDAIIAHLRRRDPDYAVLVERIVGLIRANDDRIEESRLAADVQGFAEMELGRRKPKPWSALRAARLSFDATANYLRIFAEDFRACAQRAPEAEDWKRVVERAWREGLKQPEPLPAVPLQETVELLEKGDVDAAAMRLVFFATRLRRDRQERFEDFRTQVMRQKLRAHPWIARDSTS